MAWELTSGVAAKAHPSPLCSPFPHRKGWPRQRDDTGSDAVRLPRRTLPVPRKRLGDSESRQRQLRPGLRSESRHRAPEVLLAGAPLPQARRHLHRAGARLGGAEGSGSSLEGLDPWTEGDP